ncbi:MAG: nucleotidyltransferase [Lachnospiraceae bacterium]|jgi:predicted nucleotidyltransferase|nr:nucleotidyltransferase [Lachnospiraceae bacterium]
MKDKILGIITEYNPFHNGHKYHIEKAKEITGCNKVICVMSGDFVQRGEPAIIDKYFRTTVAINEGIDLLIELPIEISTGSSEFFATGAIKLLNSLGIVDCLCFGSECGDLTTLSNIAHILTDEPSEYTTLLQVNLRNGLSFPKAREKALSEYIGDEKISDLLSSPNNILGIEYLKAIEKTHSKIIPYTIKRLGMGYHDKLGDNSMPSASSIRDFLTNSDELISNPLSGEILNGMPPLMELFILDNQYKATPIELNDFSLILRYKLLNETKETLTKYLDVTEDIANKIYNNLNTFKSITDFIEILKSKDITYSRLSRIFIHIILDIKSEKIEDITTPNYIRFLGFAKDSSNLLKEIKEKSSLPLLSKLSNTEKLSKKGKEQLENNIKASNIYQSIVYNNFHIQYINEYNRQIITDQKITDTIKSF